jgi:hypothetical protein
VGGFGWYDLNRNSQYQLIVTEDLSGRAFFDYLAIYEQNSSGTASLRQWIEGDQLGTDLGKIVRDIDGDGEIELVIPTTLVSYGTGATITWPAVYRLEKGKYVEASRDFPGFYEDEVMPKLQERINQYQGKPGVGTPDAVAGLTMVQDKILRVLGRDPTAGLQRVYEWMNSDDPILLQDAAATFQSVGGHEREMRAASDAQIRAEAREHAHASAGGKS